MKKTENRSRKFNYAWVNVALCFMMIFTCLGFCSSGKSLYTAAVTNALGISRSAYAIGDSCRYIATAILNLFFGSLLLRFGPKKLIGAGFICLISFALIGSYTTSVFGFCMAGTLLGVGLAWTTTSMVSSIIYKWCPKNQGTIMGAVLASNGLGGALSAQIITPIIYQEGNPFGYQSSYRLVALILTIVGLLVVVLLRENPKNIDDVTTATIPKKKVKGEIWSGMGFSDIIRKGYFYLATVCIFLTGMCLQGLSGIAVPHMTDIGIDPTFVATLLTFSSLLLAASKFLTGFLFDHCGLRITMNICLIAALLTITVLIFITDSPIGKFFAASYTILQPIALPLETIMLPLYASGLFGQRSFNKVQGIFLAVNTAGYAVGAPVCNLCFDFFHSYIPAFAIGGIVMLFVAISMQFVFKAASKEKRVMLQLEDIHKQAEIEA